MLLGTLCLLSTSSLVLAAKKSDPLADVKKPAKITKELQSNLRDYSKEQIAALGSSSEACKYIKLKHFGDNSAFITKFRSHVSFECAQAIFDHHQDAFDALFEEATKGERMEFVRRLGKEKVCAKPKLFSKSNLATTVETFCKEAKEEEVEVKEKKAEEEKKAEGEKKPEEAKKAAEQGANTNDAVLPAGSFAGLLALALLFTF